MFKKFRDLISEHIKECNITGWQLVLFLIVSPFVYIIGYIIGWIKGFLWTHGFLKK